MNLFFLLLIFLFFSIRSDAKSMCRSYPFKPLISPINCRCNNITHNQIGRIFNGTDLDGRDLPYVVSIYTLKIIHFVETVEEPASYCTGSIISPRFVLTAAHCKNTMLNFLIITGKKSYVGAGSNRLISTQHKSNDTHKEISEFHQHPNYGKSKVRLLDYEYINHDIGIIILKTPFKFDLSLNIQPGCLYMDLLKEEDIRKNSQIIAVGYGQQYEGDERGERHLKFTRLNIYENKDFDLNFTIFFHDIYTRICIGDSGSPLLWHKDEKLVIIGISVGGLGPCAKNSNWTVAEPIHNHLGWILKHVNGEVCGTENKINKWFDQAGEQDDITTWE